jgi:3-methyladenine DNA glycosylase AlkD
VDTLASWRSSPHRFQRRAVPVTLLALLDPLKKGVAPSSAGRPVVKRLLVVVRPMMLDEERVVQQGLGWFLREAWKRHPDLVEPLLLEFKDRAGRVIYQYATEKMSAAGKARFRKPRA